MFVGNFGCLTTNIDFLLTQEDNALKKPDFDQLALTPVITGQISHYRILNKLGKGGMSEVYLAEDTALDRRVAIKFLLPELLSSDRSRKRLIREAKAIASLDHPNICSIYEVNEEADQTFIVMQYVEGETLAARMSGGKLSLKKAVDFASQMASALVEAHSRGIVHRDIKPQNVMVGPNGLVKVLDFGLSKIIHHRATNETDMDTLSLLSNPGAVVGTVPYLSPEQARSELLDARSDIFSFGIVLYEMVTGHNPFVTKNATETIIAIATQAPPPMARFAADVPFELEMIVGKCLEKEPERRYQSARELAIDLDHLQRSLQASESTSDKGSSSRSSPQHIDSIDPRARPYVVYTLGIAAIALVIAGYFAIRPVEGPIESVAVSPFEFTGDSLASPDTKDLMAWMSNSLASSLQELSSLKKVISPYSILAFKKQAMTPQELGKAYGVQAILVGQVHQTGDQVSIHIELIRVEDNSLIKGRTYEFPVSETNAKKGEICSRITDDLRLRLSADEKTRISQKESVSSDAALDYQRGRESWNRRHLQDVKTSIEYFKRAIQEDQNYALAHAGLADSYSVLAGSENPKENAALAREEAQKALTLDSKLAEAYLSLAIIGFKFDWDWPNVEMKFTNAVRLKPGSPDAHYWYAAFLSAMGRGPEAIVESRRAADLEPLNSTYRLNVARVLYLARQRDEALIECRKALAMNPNSAVAHYILGFINLDNKQYDAAINAFQLGLTKTADKGYLKSAMAVAYASQGKKNEAKKILEELKHPPSETFVSPLDVAAIQIALSDKDAAFASLEDAYRNRSDLLAFLKVDPIYDSIRTDPRFGNLVHRVGL